MSNHREYSLSGGSGSGSGSGGVLEEDESLARLLHQQMIEEEQRMRRITGATSGSSSHHNNNNNHTSSHLSQQELDDMELARRMAQMDFEQHRRSSREDHMARARRLQEEAFSNVSSASSSSHHQPPVPPLQQQQQHQQQHNQQPPQQQHRRVSSRGVDEQLAYARSLQEQAFSNVAAAVQQQQQQQPTHRHQYSRSTEESDLELAMRMQEMEEMGLSSSRASGLALDDASEVQRHRSFSTNDASLQSRLQQEEEDARLARLMEGGGPSLRELQSREAANASSHPNHINITMDVAPRSSSGAASMPTTSVPVPVASIPRKPPPPPVPLAAAAPKPPPQAPAPIPPPPAPIPPAIPNRPPNVAYPVVSVPPSIAATMNNNSNSSSHSRTTVSSRNTYPAAVPPRMAASPTSTTHNNNPYPPAVMVNTDPPGISMPNEAAFLDVPGGARRPNEKGKRRGFFGLFRRGNPNSDSTVASAQSTPVRSPTQTSRPRRGSSQTPNHRPPRAAAAAAIPPVAIPAPIPPPPPPESTQAGPLPHSISVSQNFGRNEATAQRKGALSTCCNCKKLSTNLIVALDKKYHPECLRCVACYQIIDATQPFAFVTDGQGEKQPLHRQCYAGLYGVKCAVCKQSIPAGEDGKVSFVKHPFFDTEQMCPRHASNPGRRCTGCHRFEPEDEPFADLNDSGRCVCFACCRSVVVDSEEATVLWNKVVDFFEKLGLPIWKDMRQVPILIVGYDALNNQIARAGGSHGNSTQIMTRGLCLTEHESGRKIKLSTLRWNKNNFSFEACDAELKGFTFFQVPDASKVNPDASVTAILCLSGLPSDLVASVLAHEATHAWIKLHPRFDIANPIPPQVEEGCAQLLALLFLNDGLEPASRATLDVEGPTDEKLRQYFKFSIETDDNEIYGEGYRKAAAAYANIGIEALMSHVVLYQEFPRT